MKDVWLYDPEVCDGDLCIMHCDVCPKKEIIFEREEKDNADDSTESD